MSKRRQMVVDTEGIIGFLQDNLRDRYKDCFSIIQELLQNADDAKAKRVHFGMFKGIPNAGSLFQGPALLVVNDGPVRPSDLDAIYRIAAGNKRADDNKIGKFGLGMKSVFHVCEAFFMFGKGLDVQEDLPGFCSPWSEDFHKEWWDEWDQDINIATRALEDIIGPLVKSWPRWFCVWIPMRNAKQLGYIAPILKTMPDIGTYEELVGADSCEKAARMLPLLKNIEELSFKDWDGECRKYVLKSKGRLLPESCILSGDVVAEGKGGSGFSYFGEARLHNTDRQFLELQSLDCWPESTHKELLRKAETIVDKTKPHTAVCIMTEASSSPHVSVLPCVFLPLSGAYDKTDEYSADSGGKLAVRVCLHGSMFVDAGRQGFNIGHKLLNLPKNDIELRGEWNRRLFFDAVLPMLIPQVKKLLAEVDKEESIAIMKALSQIEYLSEHMTQICYDNFLVYELTSTGYSWNVVSAKDEIIALSSPRSSLVRKVLCESLPEHVHIIDSSAGCLVKNNIIKSSLSSEIRVAVLRTIAGMPQEESNNEDLLRFARDCASGLKFPELDEDLRLAPIWKVGNDRLSYEAIKIKSEELQIYSESISGLKQKFLSAVEWTVFSAPWELGAALGLQFRKLDVDFAIDVLHKHPRLKTVEERVDLLVALKSNAAQDWARQRSAVRYLIHGVAELFDNDAKLYTPDASLPAEFSEVVMKALSRALYHYSYSIPLKMLAKLSDEEQIEYGFGRLTKDSVAVTLANTPNISYIGFQEDAWQTLLRVSDRLFTDHMVKSALKQIPIFPFENGKRGALDDDSCYYESNVKIPTVFRETINVISIPKDEDIARRIKELVKSWRYADTFRFCRKSLLPCNQLSEILTDAIIRTPSLSAEDRAYLVETKWVPMSKGGYCQPDSIINIDGFEPPADITSKVPLNAFEDSVLSFLRRHSLLTDVTICVERFFAELAENPRYCLGRIRQSDGEDLSCDTIFSVFKNQEVLPVVSILKGMSGNKSICDNYLRLLIRPIDSDLMLGVITELTTQIRECRAPSEKQRYWRFLNSYLDEAAEYDESVFGDIFSVYEFLNLKNTLAKASELCTGGESIPSRYIISSEYKAATKFFSRLHDNQTYYVKENKDTEYSSYKEYFSDWDQDYDARIGGFIICTSDSDEDIKFVKERYWTDSRSIRENRNKLNGSYDELLKGQCAYLHAKKGSKVLIRTLIGTFHEVSMKGLDEVDNLFVSEGAPLHISPSPSTRLAVYNGGGPKLMIMRLRYVTKEELQRLSPARVDSLLKNTLHEIASRLCGTYACDIDNFWNDLANASQLSISVTREVMLNHASYYLGMLGCRDEKLNQIFEKQKDLETEMVDARKSKGDDIRRCLLQKDEILRKIGTLIETNAEISQHILEALRYEMRNRYEYNETSILYELFQNADDASEQLYTINPNEETGHGRFEVRYDGETLIIAHWGRLINSVVASGGAGLVHREFKRDLENMLVLMQSGKKNTDISVTGKFGLGFKTVFFVCDEPIVYSGGLRFKIHGGFLPQPLSEEDNEKYSSIVREFSDGSTDLKPTVFILPIVSSLRKKVEVWIESFIRNSQTVCTLSKRISRMRIVTNNGVKSVCKVMEESVLAADDKRYVINFSDGCLFFGNNDGMPCALPDDEATYWATVPTKLCLKMGVALNGNFDLTTGRAKINDSSEKNPKLVRQWSRQLFDALIKIREETENLDDGGYEFWRAIWDLFTVREHIDRWDNSGTNLLYDLIWDEQSGGYQCYLWQAPSIPSGLDGVLRVLCLPNDISHVVSREVVNSGALALLEEGSLTPGCAISEEVFIKPARKFLKKVKGLKKIWVI